MIYYVVKFEETMNLKDLIVSTVSKKKKSLISMMILKYQLILIENGYKKINFMSLKLVILFTIISKAMKNL